MSNAVLSHSKFIHIPKCAGSAIQSCLWHIGCIQHENQVIGHPHYGHLFASQMKDDGLTPFAFVRNPLAWWHSYYHWNMNPSHSRFDKCELRTDSFDQWVSEYGQLWLGKYTLIVKRYLGEDANFPTTNTVRHVGKAENAFADLREILRTIGQPHNRQRLEEVIRGNTKPWEGRHDNIQSYDRSAISRTTKEIIYNTEQDIFERFSY